MMEQDATASPAIAAEPVAAAAPALPGAKTARGMAGAVPGTGLRLFLVHAPEDAWFVEGFLLPALGLAEDEVLCSGKIEPGAMIVQEIERGAVSPVTVVVASPAFLASPWARFANQLAVHHSVEAANDGSALLVPAILADCDLPLLARWRVPLDFRDPARGRWEAEVGKLRARLAAPVRAPAVLPCPYPGLRPFSAEDAARFHGRDREIRDLLGRLRDGQRELYVIGPSGSGKSSLVAAGLVPRLGSFVVRRLRPGADPATALATALEATIAEPSSAAPRWPIDAASRLLANDQGRDRLLIFVDQLEEIFTTASAAARTGFFMAVRALRGDPRVALVLTLRADFYASLMESALWADLGGQLSRLDVGPLSGAQLRLAIEAPARALGVYFEPVLIERLLHDVASEPGALPLLQDTLLELWDQRTHGLLRLAEYDAMSDGTRTGLAVAVARRADGALNALPPGQRDIARRVLLRLVQFGDGTAAGRRQQARAALAAAGDAPDQIDAVIRHLADWRLIITSGGDDAASPRIDLAHEVLLSAWPVLGEWIRSRKQDEQHRRTLEAKAAEWVRGGRGPYRLLDADELREARDWLSGDKARDLGVSDDLEALLARSAAALSAQLAEADARRRRWRRWVTVALAGLVAAVAAVSTLAVIAWRRSEEATAQAAVADAASRSSQRQLARTYVLLAQQQLMSGRPVQALPYLVAAREAGAAAGNVAGDAAEALRRQFRWAVQGIPWRRFVHQGSVDAVAWSPDGSRVATASQDGTARVWDVASGQAVTQPLVHRDQVWAAAWSPDGKRVATASQDGTARVWDAASGQAVTPPLTHEDHVRAVAWSPDGRQVATASDDGTARIWDAASGQAITSLRHERWVVAVAWSPDGRRVATASTDGTARVWDAARGQPVTPPLSHDGVVRAVAWRPDGAQIATASEDGTARVWDVSTGHAAATPLTHDSDAAVMAVAWRPDGQRVATASADGTVRLWDGFGRRSQPALVHRGAVRGVAWSPDGQRVATASGDGTAQVWDARSGTAVTLPLVHLNQQSVNAVAWSPDGRWLATGGDDGTARVWPADGASVTTPLESVSAVAWSPDGGRIAVASAEFGSTTRVRDTAIGRIVVLPSDDVRAMVWSPDGTRVATAHGDHAARVWDAASGQVVTPPLVHARAVNTVAWSPDGTRIATSSADDTARVWDAASGQAVTPPLAHLDIRAVAWSLDGKRVVTASEGSARVWDAVHGQAVTAMRELHGHGPAVALSPDGSRMATSWSGTARVWDVLGEQAVTPLLAQPQRVFAMVWSPDQRRLAISSLDGAARVWDAVTGQPLTPPLEHGRDAVAVAWSPDGRWVATAGDETVRVWDVASGQAVTPRLADDSAVRAVTWNPDGRRLATLNIRGIVRVWDVSGDPGTLADWRAVLERGDYRLNAAGVVVVRDAGAAAGSLPASAAAR